MTTNPNNEQRIRALERQLADLRRDFNLLSRRPQAAQPQIRVVKTSDDTTAAKSSEGADPPDYPDDGTVTPIIFQDVTFDDLDEDAVFDERSDVSQNLASTLDGSFPDPDLVFVAFKDHNNRWLLIPNIVPPKIVKPDADIDDDESGTCSVWQKNASTGTLEDTGDNITAYHDWMTGGLTLEAGTESLAFYFPDEYGGIWRIIGAACA